VTDRDEFVWLQQKLPWIGAGFIHRIPHDGIESAVADLRGLGFEVWTLEGTSMTDAQTFHTEAEGLRLPALLRQELGCVQRLLRRAGTTETFCCRLVGRSSAGLREPEDVRRGPLSLQRVQERALTRGRAARVVHRARLSRVAPGVRRQPPKTALSGVGLPQVLPHSRENRCKSPC